MNFNLFCFVFVFAWLAQLYTSEEKTELEVKSVNNLEIVRTTPTEDYKPVQAFQHFVYPKKYSTSMSNNTLLPRNITLDKINYHQASTSLNEKLLRIVDDRADYRQNYPNNYYNNFDSYQPQQGFQPHFLNQGNSMMHLVDPLFLMATLAFVVFLINSILGLVNKLNLPIIGGGVKRDHAFNDLNDGERDRMNVEILDEIENIIKNALFEFKKHLN
ncbi:hypothetical protein HA402_002119 [Bradysia odoriphaga]|nr:hypothetical protein HA402_002119 [Bradysia odoriphaga]